MKVVSNTAISLDGRITDRARSRVMLGSPADRRRMRALRAAADAILVGGETFRTWARPFTEAPFHRPRPILNVVLTRRGILTASDRHWPDPRAHLLVLGPPSLDADQHRKRFGAEVIHTTNPSPAWALDVLAARGCEQVLVEGGGGLIGPLLEANRLDTLHVTICPIIIGGQGAPTLADGDGRLAGKFQQLHLRCCEREEHEMFMTYDVVRTTTASST